jgi:hypothetical protein
MYRPESDRIVAEQQFGFHLQSSGPALDPGLAEANRGSRRRADRPPLSTRHSRGGTEPSAAFFFRKPLVKHDLRTPGY